MRKKIGIILLAVLAVLVLFPAGYFAYCGLTYKGQEDSAKVAYLRGHRYVIPDGEVRIPQAFGQRIETVEGRVFVLGEQHGFSPTHLLSAKLLIYLNRHRGVRTFATEIYASVAERLNRLLSADSLDKQELVSIIHDIGKQIPQSETDECLKEWEAIYAYNRSAEADHKLHVVGLLGVKGDNKGLLYDQIMAKSLLDFMQDPANSRLVQQGCYCFVGFTHALQSPYLSGDYKVPTFAYLLKQHRLSVTSMVQMALDSYAYMPKSLKKMGMPIIPPDEKTKTACANGSLTYFTNVINLEQASADIHTAIYALDGAGSPYSHCYDLVGIKSVLPFFIPPFKALPSRSTLDYYQYLFVVNGHQSPKPISPKA